MNKELPISNPPLKTYQFFLFSLNALANNDDYLPWFYTTHLMLLYNVNANSLSIFANRDVFLDNPWLESNVLTKYFFDLSKFNFMNYIKNAIAEQYYVKIYVNEFYLVSRNSYNKEDNDHDILIYGYNDNKNVFLTYGYDKSGYPQKHEIMYSVLEKAFNATQYRSGNQIITFRKKLNYSFELNLQLLSNNISDYLQSTNNTIIQNITQTSKKEKFVFGHQVYDMLVKELELHINGKKTDIRNWYFFYEHKMIIGSMIKFIEACKPELEISALSDNYKNVIHSSLLIEKNILKSLYLMSEKKIINCIEMLKDIKEEESQILRKFINILLEVNYE